MESGACSPPLQQLKFSLKCFIVVQITLNNTYRSYFGTVESERNVEAEKCKNNSRM